MHAWRGLSGSMYVQVKLAQGLPRVYGQGRGGGAGTGRHKGKGTHKAGALQRDVAKSAHLPAKHSWKCEVLWLSACSPAQGLASAWAPSRAEQVYSKGAASPGYVSDNVFMSAGLMGLK